jgi:hypothetical protein
MGDNCKTVFGGIWCSEEGNIIFAKIKMLQKKSLIGIGCPAHILNNCLLMQ